MNYRRLGKTGFEVSEISLGTWQVGGKWGSAFDDKNAEAIIEKAIDGGVNFIDTADVYSDGLSEAAVSRVVKRHKNRVFVATKCGRKVSPHVNAGYTPQVLRSFVEISLRNMNAETIDLIQLHCPPWEALYRPEIFELFDKLKSEGKIRNLGVSVEKVEEALKAITWPNVTTIQIIFNIFRQRPADLFFREAAKADVGILARVPLASGLLTGTFSKNTSFGPQDHRTFNREGSAFDKGETFGGIDYETGLKAVEELKALFPGVANLAPYALKWILSFPEVTCVIPGASGPSQVASNMEALALPDFTGEQFAGIKKIYENRIKRPVHYLW